MSDILLSDCIENCDHPRSSVDLIGHQSACKRLFEAYVSGKMPHAWIISGEAGIGKATLAYRLARFIFKYPDISTIKPGMSGLHVDVDDPVFRRVNAGAHADLLVLRREFNDKRKKLFTEIRAGDVRRTGRFFSQSASEGGWRICILDTADEMSLTAANALLKILEEPPRQALFLILSNTPHRLLPTIRSRCCKLSLAPLGEEDVRAVFEKHIADEYRPADADMAVLARLSNGSPGRAIRLALSDGAAAYRNIHGFMNALPGLDLVAAHALASDLGGAGRITQFNIFFDLLEDWIHAMVQGGLGMGGDEIIGGEGDIIRRLAPPESLAHWSTLWEKVNLSLARARALNLDRKQLVLDTLFSLQETARKNI